MPDEPAFYISLIVTFLSGGVVGALLNHFFSSTRDRRARRHGLEDRKQDRLREFVSFLGGFRSEAERTSPTQFCEVFPSRVHRFREESAKVRADLDGKSRTQFDESVAALCKLTDPQVSEVETYSVDPQGQPAPTGRVLVLKAIDAVIQSLE